MSYSTSLRIVIPGSIYLIACSIARSLDPDTGGYHSFGSEYILDESGNSIKPEVYSTETPCTEEFALQAKAMLSNPEMLHAVVAKDYESRWKELDAPSLEDCKLFCDLAEVTTPNESSDLLVKQNNTDHLP